MNKISFHDTHTYPGCSAIIFFKIPSGTTVTTTTEFSDGSIATAVVEQVDSGEVLVHIDAYTTARGTHDLAAQVRQCAGTLESGR